MSSVTSRPVAQDSPKAVAVETWEPAGKVGVDAGLLMLVDPGYVLHKDKPIGKGTKLVRTSPLDPAFGKDWHDFCDKLEEARPDRTVGGLEMPQMPLQNAVTQIQSAEPGSWCSAVVIGGFGGDGIYPVSVRRDARGLVEAVKVEFSSEEASP